MYGIYAMAASGRMQYDYNNNNNVQCSAIKYIHQPHTFNAAQLGTFVNHVRSAQRN